MRLALTTADAAAFPDWLHVLAMISVVLAVVCAVIILIDVIRRPQPMSVMNAVWPITALFGSVLWLAAYLWWGRAAPRASRAAAPMASAAAPGATDSASDTGGMSGMDMDMGKGGMSGMDMGGMSGMDMSEPLGMSRKPHNLPVSVFVGTCHCGGGCSLADLLVAWAAFAVPAVAVLGGAGWLFPEAVFGVWVLATIVAWIFGVAFQYFAIKPMRGLTPKEGLIAAIKADTFSILAWQVGMIGGIALFQLVIFPATVGGMAPADTFVYWFMMQLAMLLGFATAYPMNWLLIHLGVKERM